MRRGPIDPSPRATGESGALTQHAVVQSSNVQSSNVPSNHGPVRPRQYIVDFAFPTRVGVNRAKAFHAKTVMAFPTPQDHAQSLRGPHPYHHTIPIDRQTSTDRSHAMSPHSIRPISPRRNNAFGSACTTCAACTTTPYLFFANTCKEMQSQRYARSTIQHRVVRSVACNQCTWSVFGSITQCRLYQVRSSKI